MDTSTHNLNTLFQQLGLSNTETNIDHFIASHSIEPTTKITEAFFWNDAQISFLKDALTDDSDWAELVDYLDCLLRHYEDPDNCFYEINPESFD